MPRYIDAEELLHRLPDHLPYKASVRRVLIQAPSADVQEVRHAKFELVNNGKGVCNNCHRLDSIDKLAKYCRYCGAKIRGWSKK